jgi:hypothetical protein
MKKLICFAALALPVGLLAQEPADALRFSWTTPGGTARTQAVGGAMGSLGGDISATFVNPAGLAFYRTGDLVLSPNFSFGKQKASYFGTRTSTKDRDLTLGTSGVVLGSGVRQGRIRNSAFSLAVNRSGNFNGSLEYKGQTTESSFTQVFLEELRNNNIRDGSAAEKFPGGTSLAVNTFLVDTVGGGTSGNYQFQSRAANVLGTGLLQQNTIKSRGGVTELALGLAVNVRDKLMFGGTIGVPFLYYNRESEFLEADATENGNNQFNYAIFKNSLTTQGTGFNAKLGMIYKPAEFWRLGLAFHTPTVYSLTDTYESELEADVESADNSVWTDYSRDYNYGEPNQAKYTLITPYRAIGSISYVLREIEDVTKQRGFLTADVEYINYKVNSFHPDDEYAITENDADYLKDLNKAVDRAYKGAFNFRVGGELKFTVLMLRLGAAYYGNPYKDIRGEKGHKLNLSGGLGYRHRGKFIDLTYVHQTGKDVNFPYRLQYGPYSGASINSRLGQVLLTVGWKI